jgi:hypothetical protein
MAGLFSIRLPIGVTFRKSKSPIGLFPPIKETQAESGKCVAGRPVPAMSVA